MIQKNVYSKEELSEKCKESPYENQVGNCLLELAEEFQDENICNMIGVEYLKINCLAIVKNDPSICELSSVSDNCYFVMAFEKKNVTTCKMLGSGIAHTACVFDIATRSSDIFDVDTRIELCSEILDETGKKTCIDYIKIKQENSNTLE